MTCTFPFANLLAPPCDIAYCKGYFLSETRHNSDDFTAVAVGGAGLKNYCQEHIRRVLFADNFLKPRWKTTFHVVLGILLHEVARQTMDLS